MGKKKATRIDVSGEGPGASAGGGLTHNPFAALRRDSSCADTQGAAPGGGRRAHEPLQVTEPALDGEAQADALLRGAALVVRHERKGHGGKTVTVVDCSRATLATGGSGLDAIARDLRKALGVGARATGAAITLQGDLVERVARHLESTYGACVTLGTRR